MSFKVYKNKKTGHTSVSIKQNDKKHWFNMPMSHAKPNDSYIETKVFLKYQNHLKKSRQNSYIRKYIRKDKRGIRGHPYKEIFFDNKTENTIKDYLKSKYKKR